MAKILLDACVPQSLRNQIDGHQVETARFAGLDELPDGELLEAIEGRYDILITLDRNLTYQQKITNRELAVIVIQVAEQTPEAFKTLTPKIEQAIGQAKVGKVLEVEE